MCRRAPAAPRSEGCRPPYRCRQRRRGDRPPQRPRRAGADQDPEAGRRSVRNAVFLIQGTNPETVRISCANAAEIGVLISVDIFLGDHGAPDAGKIHVSNQAFRAVDSVRHCGGKHLADLPAELAAATAHIVYRQAVHDAVLFEPKMGMRIDHGKTSWFSFPYGSCPDSRSRQFSSGRFCNKSGFHRRRWDRTRTRLCR